MADSSQRRQNDRLLDRYLLAPNVILMPLENGKAALLDLDGSCFGLSAMATEMLKGTLEQGGETAVHRVAAEYQAESDVVRADFAELLAKLRAKGLIRRGDDRLPTARVREAIASCISYPALRIFGRMRNQRLKAFMLLTLARASFACAGWVRTVEAWQNRVNRPETSLSNSDQEQLIDEIDLLIRRTGRRMPLIACKERALCCWYMLHSAGVPVQLVMGAQFSPFSGHCWCEAGERILTDLPERCEAYTPVIRYG